MKGFLGADQQGMNAWKQKRNPWLLGLELSKWK